VPTSGPEESICRPTNTPVRPAATASTGPALHGDPLTECPNAAERWQGLRRHRHRAQGQRFLQDRLAAAAGKQWLSKKGADASNGDSAPPTRRPRRSRHPTRPSSDKGGIRQGQLGQGRFRQGSSDKGGPDKSSSRRSARTRSGSSKDTTPASAPPAEGLETVEQIGLGCSRLSPDHENWRVQGRSESNPELLDAAAAMSPACP